MIRASCILGYGDTNTWKTTNLGRAARYIFEMFGMVCRMPSADNEYDTVANEINDGLIEPFSLVAIPNPFGVTKKICEGYWPEVVNGKLIMKKTPVVDGYMINAKGQRIGGYLVEGTTTIAELLHQDHINKGRKIGEDLVGKFDDQVETDKGLEVATFAKSAQSHYGQVQDYVVQFMVPALSMLPGLKWVIWTGHEYLGENEIGQVRLGPGVVGKAATTKITRKIGNTFHFVRSETIDMRTRKRTFEHRAYCDLHPDAQLQTMLWHVAIKLPAHAVPSCLAKFPDGYIPLSAQQGIEVYMRHHDEHAIKILATLPDTITPDNLSAPVVSVEVLGLQTGSPAPVSLRLPPQHVPLVSDVKAPTQTQPVVRPSGRPARFGRPTLVPPTLATQLQKSIDAVQQAKAASQVQVITPTEPPTENVVPDINSLPTTNNTEKEK